ncbi:MAG: ABC transporter substrate-binding protein [Phycisphaerales bacterium]
MKTFDRLSFARRPRAGALIRSALMATALAATAGFAALTGPSAAAQSTSGMKTLHIPMTTNGPKSLDPVIGSTTYENRVCSQIYDTLLQYKYLKRPYELEGNVTESMPEVSDDGLVWTFKLKDGVFFHDDPCFSGGKGREMTAHDVVYSWKRLADPAYKYKSWWLLEDMIVGFDEYKDAQAKRVDSGEKFDYDQEVEGLRALDDKTLQVTLKRPVQQFIWRVPMFQLSIVPREAVETYGERFNLHPVGSGPFILKNESDWEQGARISLHRNPNYREDYYPSEADDEFVESGKTKAAGQRVPFIDRLDVTFFVEENPMWLEFDAGNLGFTTVPDAVFDTVFTRRSKRLKSSFEDRGVAAYKVPLLDFIFRGFNMEDPLIGGYSEKQKALRQAISLAIDLEEFNQAFYSGTCIVYDGPIPPALDGYPENGQAEVSYRGPDLERAREYLAKAGYPNGQGLPSIDYYTSRGSVSEQHTQLLQRQLERIGVNLNPRLVDFSVLIDAVDNKKAPMFSFAWGSDYPDAENNLMLFYGPNEAPKPNHFNYKNEEFDRMYEKIRTMPPGPERTAMYEQMRNMVIEDVPYVGSLARTRHYVAHPWLENFEPTETFFTWYKYLDVDQAGQRRANGR